MIHQSLTHDLIINKLCYPECKISDSIVFSPDNQDKFTIQSIEERNKKIEEDMMEKLMLEYEIMSSVYGGKE